ncbi:hypothetical protein SAMN05421788_105124 [Filimonas lacunae]|uniref:Uncharacterized protein n=1 Tax=Filimonas lacunae TaxID=477680 RepID=A0A173MCW2_9BACT|nr:hypothetical protein [Filimonas lacunae]BAV05423.1 hypothetical protein FLA_1430 [Filimonas lacunae]SIT21245.1 hypothetical protein SAMN05421788_105124 [Filimonas lacunae]
MKNTNRFITILFFTVLSALSTVAAQEKAKDSAMHIRNIAWTTPVSKNTTVNGIALGAMAMPIGMADSLRIHGCSVDLSPLGLFLSFYAVPGTFMRSVPDSSKGGKDPFRGPKYYVDSTIEGVVINGLAISGGGMFLQAKMRGIQLNGCISMAGSVQGLEISGFVNLHHSFSGVMIAGIRNKVARGRGLQIALFNNCKEGQLVQIGLINRIGKRVLPFFNCSFKRTRA